MWTILEKTLILENRHHFMTMFIWVVLNENVKPANVWIQISAGATAKYFTLRNLAQTCPRGPMTFKVRQRNAWKDIQNWRTKQLSCLYKVATPCMDDQQLKEEEMGYKLARAITRWTRACDRRLALLISYIPGFRFYW